jgi:hypothetical protein
MFVGEFDEEPARRSWHALTSPLFANNIKARQRTLTLRKFIGRSRLW